MIVDKIATRHVDQPVTTIGLREGWVITTCCDYSDYFYCVFESFKRDNIVLIRNNVFCLRAVVGNLLISDLTFVFV